MENKCVGYLREHPGDRSGISGMPADLCPDPRRHQEYDVEPVCILDEPMMELED